MHKMYAKHYNGVTADFALNVRKTKLALTELQNEHPALYEELLASIGRLCSSPPYGPATREALQKYFSFDTDEVTTANMPIATVRLPSFFSSSSLLELTGGKVYCLLAHPPSSPTLPYPRFLLPSLPRSPSQAMQSRAAAYGVTRNVSWLHLDQGEEKQLLALASGPIESASHVETSLMQLVQEFIIRAQVRAPSCLLTEPARSIVALSAAKSTTSAS